jgi:hypothetical protein
VGEQRFALGAVADDRDGRLVDMGEDARDGIEQEVDPLLTPQDGYGAGYRAPLAKRGELPLDLAGGGSLRDAVVHAVEPLGGRQPRGQGAAALVLADAQDRPGAAAEPALGGGGEHAPGGAHRADERQAVGAVDGGNPVASRRQAGQHAGLRGVSVHEVEGAATDEAPDREQRQRLGARLAHSTPERHRVVRHSRALDAFPYDSAGRSRDVRLPSVGSQPERQLRDVLRHAPVGGLEGEEDAAHGVGS